MVSKVFRMFYNGIRFLGSPVYRELIAVDPSVKISRAPSASFRIGKHFRTRRKVEVNVREKRL